MNLVDLILESIEEELAVDDEGNLSIKPDDKYSLLPTEKPPLKAKDKNKFGQEFKVFTGYNFVSQPTLKKKLSKPALAKLSDTKTMLRIAAKAMKGGNKKIVNDLLDNMIARFMATEDASKLDVLVVPGSKSPINSIIAKKLKAINPQLQVLSDVLIKATWKEVKINQHFVGREDPKGYTQAGKSLAAKQKLHPDEDFEIKKSGSMSRRRYFSNFYKIPEDKVSMVIDVINDKNVCVMDDTYEEGVTFIDILRVLKDYEPKSIVGLVFLHGV